MLIYCISDTHMKHRELNVPNVDMIIHTGDGTNYNDKYRNEPELRDFLDWFSNLPTKYKIFTGGNHDTALASNMVPIPDNIILLQDQHITIEGIKIFGSPYTLAFGFGWAYNMQPHKASSRWANIDSDTDIIATHGPPRGILDVTVSQGRLVEQCGDKALLNRVLDINPKYHIFGHLHDEKNVYNSGMFQNKDIADTEFINASVVDLRHNLVNNGRVIEI